MDTVQKLLDAKGHAIWSVSPDDMVYDAVAEMAEKGCGALLVMEGDELKGIISERDYARQVVLEDRSSKETKVSEIMTCDVITAEPGRSVEECLTLMTDKRIRHLPIMSDGRLVGMVSIGDLVKSIIAEQRYLIQQLEQYIKQ